MDIAKIKDLNERWEFHHRHAAIFLEYFNKTKSGDLSIIFGLVPKNCVDDCLPMILAFLDHYQHQCELHQKRAFELMTEIVELLPENLRE